MMSQWSLWKGYPAIVFGDHTRIFKFIEEPFVWVLMVQRFLEPKVELDRKFILLFVFIEH